MTTRTEKPSVLAVFAILPALVLLTTYPIPCQASTIELGIVGDAQVGPNYIDFGQYPNGAPYTPAPGYGTFQVSLVNSGVFSNAGVTTGELGFIQSLNSATGSVTLPSAFMTFFVGGSNLRLQATNIPAGTVGPFVLTDTAAGAVAAFDVNGIISDSSNPGFSQSFAGTFAVTFAGQNVASLFGALPINTPFTATFSMADPTPPPAATPEPTSVLLMGAGLIGLGAMISRRRRRS